MQHLLCSIAWISQACKQLLETKAARLLQISHNQVFEPAQEQFDYCALQNRNTQITAQNVYDVQPASSSMGCITSLMEMWYYLACLKGLVPFIDLNSSSQTSQPEISSFSRLGHRIPCTAFKVSVDC